MDPTHQTLNLFITYVDKEGPFLKVWGQAEKNNSIYVEQFLRGASQSFETGIGIIPFEALQIGSLVCAKYKDNKYYRARIVSIDYLNECFVEVNFLDYGNKDLVPSENIRSLQNFPPSFISLPPLATGFIFAEAHCPGGGEWKDQIFEVISKELRYREVQCHLLTQATQYYLIRLFIDSTDIGALFISRGLMQPIPLHAQQAVLLSMSMQKKAPTPPAQVTPPTEINTFKACTLEQNQQYAVYVSFVNEGPSHFSVQLQQSEHMLAKLMKEINETNLRMLEEVPLPGTICLARCQEDGNICRAVVTNEVDNQFKVFYVDFGNYETLPLEALYQIPFKYVLPKVMAIRLALSGVEKSTVTLEMLMAFKKFVDNRLLYMKVLPSPKKIVIPKCELWDPATKTNALDVINRAAQHAYPEPLLLNRGFTQPVKVSYVFSCNRFFVQLVSKEQELGKLMEELQISCPTSDSIDDIKIGLPCCALYEVDQLWYRSEIVDVVDQENVKVRYIDYGNEEIVPVAHLRIVEGELLTVLRPQAIECCLNGYQNMGPDQTRDNSLEELILEQNFTMKVSEMLGKKALVELIDANNYNIASLLLEKIAAAKSQVSPMLVQAGNKIEHRKSGQSDSSDSFRGQKKPARDLNKDWANRNDKADGRNSDRTNEKSWRSDNNTRQNDVNSNDASPDGGGGSWRQNNKGFSHNNDRNERNDRGDRNQRGDRPNINDRFNRNKPDRETDNWNKKDNGLQTAGDSWSSPTSDAPPPAAASPDNWATSPVPNNDFKKSRDGGLGANKKRFDRGDRDGDSRGDRGGRVNREDRGDRNLRGGWTEKDGNKKDGFKSDGFRNDGFKSGGFKSDGFKSDGFRNDGFKKDGFKKDFRKTQLHKYKRDGSEMSSSGSEKSFKKGPRTSSRNDYGGGKFQNRSNNSFANTTVNDSWSVSDVSTPIDAAPSTATFEQQEVVGTEAAVVISWFHNPGHFYCQLQGSQTEFRTLMEDIQQFYKNRKPEKCVVGAPVVGLFPEDNVLYRAQILEALGGQFKVFYVDFGNVSTIPKVWPIEKKFMTMPAQAICCGLNGVGPNGDSWQDVSVFRNWFQKEQYMARFLEKDEKRTYLQLWDGQEEISRLLIQENLVLPSEKPSEDIEVSLLLGQQFRVILKSVNNLSDIIVALECGLALNCKAHNLEMASESFEDVLKAYLEKVLIVYVDNILENNILDVTFYDVEGNKLVILNPDEGALDNVEPLCPILIISSHIYGYVSHADETSVFIQPNEYADEVNILLEQMHLAYESASEIFSEETSIIPEEGFVYAVLSEDGNWYRGRVVSYDDDKAEVSYIDYGNGESVGFNALRKLKSNFNTPNIMCLQVTPTTGPAQSYLEKDVVATICYGESGWEGAVEVYAQATTEEVSAQQPADGGMIEPLPEASGDSVPQDGTLVPDVVQEQQFSREALQEYGEEYVQENAAVDQIATATEALYIADQKGTPVFVSHIDSPTEFYVQLAESATVLFDLQQNLQDTAEGMPVLENISAGVLCAAPYSVDHQWYRAEVLDADDDITTVRFVDYGNTDVINNMNTQVKTLPSNLLTPAVYATRCSLKLKAIQDEWSQSALELFEGLANQENVVAEFIIQDEKTNIVELYANGVNVKDVLLEQGLAVPCEIVTESKTTCFVSHLNSPSEFWVQMENCVDELEWIAEQLSGAEKFPELEDMTPGTLCAALFPDDEMWYRARILSNTIAGIELLFIDYGNSCVSSSLRQLPEDLIVTSPLAQKCCLQRPEGIPYWTKEAQDKFAEISAEGQTIFEMKKITSGETATVELALHGENIVTKILPLTEEGYIKNFETLDKFSIEKNGELLLESFSLETMPGMEWNEESHKKFLEVYPEGTKFGVELISDDIVRLYQNDSDIRTNLGGVRSNLNLSNTQEDKTENLDISEEHVIDYEAGGDTLPIKHSNEDITQEIPSVKETEQETTKDITPLNEVCDKQDTSLEIDLQESANTDTSGEKEAIKDKTQDSETDSGHHSEHDFPKEDEKLAEDQNSSKREEILQSGDLDTKDMVVSSDGLESMEKPVVTPSLIEKQIENELESEKVSDKSTEVVKLCTDSLEVKAEESITVEESNKPTEETKETKEATPEDSPRIETLKTVEIVQEGSLIGETTQADEGSAKTETTKPIEAAQEEVSPEGSPKKEATKTVEVAPTEVALEDSPKKEAIKTVEAAQKDVSPEGSPKKEATKTVEMAPTEVAPEDSPKKEAIKTVEAAQKEVSPEGSPKKEASKTVELRPTEVAIEGVSKKGMTKPVKVPQKGVSPVGSPKKEATKTVKVAQKEVAAKGISKKEVTKSVGVAQKEVTSKTSPKNKPTQNVKVEQKQVTPKTSPKKEKTSTTSSKTDESKTSQQKVEAKPNEELEETYSRPSSTEGRRISHDDRIVPAVYSAPHSPLPDDSNINECTVTPSEQREERTVTPSEQKEERTVTPSDQKEERTVTPSEQKEERTVTPSEKNEPYSRPSSAEGGRINHDDRILPAVLSRPQTPISDESENK